ncbi:GAF domain-containing protein [Parvularcula dongshanensis]|uniref:histidine kinase n=1 Tax=Parvularcula dongshanensis TaxID=1173995 RepID=A0A840I3I0_9PROT|nr:two-component sensor histidine kinase [Parvularcula dongshanensis]
MTQNLCSGGQALDDPERLAALRRTGLLEGGPEEVFDRAVRLATRLLSMPVGLLSLVEQDRQVFKGQTGLGGRTETPISHSFCQHVVMSGKPLSVDDARLHPLVRDNPAVEELGVVSYLGVPVRSPDGHVIGSFCAIGTEPRRWTKDDLDALQDIAAGVSSEIDLRAALRRAEESEAELSEALNEKDVLLHEVNHRVQNLFSLVPAIATLSARSAANTDDLVSAIRERVSALARAHALTVNLYSEDRGVALDALIRAVLEPYEDRADAFMIDGPSVRLASKSGNMMGLALHELATNAAKYGALLSPHGRIGIKWRVETTPDARTLVFSWREAGGPKVATEPNRAGFGTKLIDRLFSGQNGSLERKWKATGLEVTMHLPLPVKNEV